MHRTGAAGAVAALAALLTMTAPVLLAPAVAGTDQSRVRAVDVQAHRGGTGRTVENTLASFGRALDLGVTTLELDVQITEDGHAVVTHDRDPVSRKCVDTAPAFPGDPLFPYVPGRTFVKDLTLAQVRTIDCGSLAQPEFPGQVLSPGARMPLLSEVFDLVRERRARQVRLNVETKVEAEAPEQTAPREQFVEVVTREVRDAGMLRQVSVQSFDWGALMRVREVEPRLPIVALTNGQQFLQAGLPGASPWLGGLDVDDFGGSFVEAAASFGADAVSPVHGDPQGGRVTDPGYRPFTTPELVRAAHDRGMDVVVWTVDDEATMRSLLDAGVDGIITDRPDRLRAVLAERGLRLPRAYPARPAA